MMNLPQPSRDRIERLEQLLRTFTGTYGSDSELARQVARNLATARAERAERRGDYDTDDAGSGQEVRQ